MADEKSRRGKYMHVCGVPGASCSGTTITTNAGLRERAATKAHPDPQSAYRCHVRYLLSQGYTPLPSNAFAPPDPTQPVRVLTKPTRFGAVLRNGKGGRQMTQRKSGPTRAGHVVST